eukprot:CAMPEP_0178570702 /NCGR_PEP_ID=MMETSP0697-20121206/17222_1 /TAXON_ID=265572 /ORGANISM="Extubocellulus spinifer, Strain CCMP396" /LENGTH=187 /DNA_ID=CAMNT_0020205165 /DNA_START=53 /DNA_END=616 /DNA_ORIENTATION=-
MMDSMLLLLFLFLVLGLAAPVDAFTPPATAAAANTRAGRRLPQQQQLHIPPAQPATSILTSSSTSLQMAQVSQKEAQTGIDKVVAALRRDRSAQSELGKLTKVNNVLGYGSPKAGELAVRFNASFQKGGMGRMAKAMPFGLGQTNESEGRGTMVGQVKASIDTKSGKVTSCSVFRDLGYGRAFNLKV